MQRLELTWIGKDKEIHVEPRILLHDASKDYGDTKSENMLIHGDNLLALKALEQEYAGKVKCIYIDPPYNTGAAFEHYDDNLEHSQWLSLMYPRLKILKSLLSNKGSIWISIDDDEGHYLKVICDEIFGRENFISTVIWEKKFSPQNDAKWLSDSHDFILVYAKNKIEWKPFLLPRTADMDDRYKNLDNDPRGPWTPSDFTARTYSENTDYPITTPGGRVVTPTKTRSWISTIDEFNRLVKDNRIWFGKKGVNVPRKKVFLSEVQDGVVPTTTWRFEEVGSTQDAKKEAKSLNPEDPFATPKPEKLIEKILKIATLKNDLVLDSFLGSGTTAAVAHKMGRKWIGIELGSHCYTHCKERMDKVIAGEQGGVSRYVNWQGGGGYKFYELASTLIVNDKHGNHVFSPEYNPEMVVAAVAKLNGYAYSPSKEEFWKQGYSQDNSFIFVTTNFFTAAMLDGIAQELGTMNKLLVCASAFEVGLNKRYENINVKKIPRTILDKCEYGINDYNLNIVNPPEYDGDDGDEDDD